jgi:CRP-like cAMP-binding protein
MADVSSSMIPLGLVERVAALHRVELFAGVPGRALVPQPRTASVTALEPTFALRLDKTVLDDLLLEWPELSRGVIEALVARLRMIASQVGTER